MHEVGFEPTNHKGTALKAAGFDRSPTHALLCISLDMGLEPMTTSLKG